MPLTRLCIKNFKSIKSCDISFSELNVLIGENGTGKTNIDAISKTKMKEPIVLFDEPEISLHSSYLDELTGAMLDVNSRLRIVVATHSSRLTKNIVTGAEKVSLYNVKLTNKYIVRFLVYVIRGMLMICCFQAIHLIFPRKNGLSKK